MCLFREPDAGNRLSSSMSGKRNQDQVQPDCGDAAKAKSMPTGRLPSLRLFSTLLKTHQLVVASPGMSQPSSKRREPQAVTLVMNCKIRSKDGPWLWRFSVFKKGLPLEVTDWRGVVARPNQYVFTFEFVDVENSAWIGPYRLAQFLRRMLSERDKIQTEIVELS